MNKAKKAALLNALLFPGWGHIYLHQYSRAAVFLLPVLIATLFLAWMVIDAGLTIIKAAPFQRGSIQLVNIFQVTFDALSSIEWSYALLVLGFIFILWMLSIFDAYRLGNSASILTTGDRHESTFDQP